MADNFDMKKFLVENKLGAYSKLKEEKFYAPNYVAKKYGSKAKEIEDNIEDEKDNNPNIWDLYTSLETEKETDEFVKGFMNENETASSLTPLQQHIYDYEVEISGEDFANEELENIKKLNTISDVEKYYGAYRGWDNDKDFKYDLIRLIKTLKSKKLAEGEAAYEYEKGKAAGEKEEKEKLAKEDLDKDRTDAEAEKMMDFLSEEEKVEEGLSDIKNFFLKVADNIKKGVGSECVAEYNMAIKAGKSDREAIAIYDTCLSGEKGGFQGPSITKATYGIAEKKVEEAIAPDAIERMEGLANIQDLAALKTKLMILASDWNQEGFEKEDVLEYIKHLLDNQFNKAKKPMKEGEDIFADIEDDLMHGTDSKRDQIEYLQEVIDWCQNKIEEIKDTNMDEAMGGKNPEGDALVLRFLKGVAKKFDYPVAKAAIFVKDTIKSLGY